MIAKTNEYIQPRLGIRLACAVAHNNYWLQHHKGHNTNICSQLLHWTCKSLQAECPGNVTHLKNRNNM